MFTKDNFMTEIEGKNINILEDFYANAKLENKENEKSENLIKNYLYSIKVSKKIKFLINSNSENNEISI